MADGYSEPCLSSSQEEDQENSIQNVSKNFRYTLYTKIHYTLSQKTII
jgi:hypothetical protein